MNRLSMKWTAVMLLCGSIAVSQDLPRPAENKAQAIEPIEILTDTQGVDFGPYLARVVMIVKQNWYRMIPESAMPPIMKKGKLQIRFVILKDGKVRAMVLEASSGDITFDRAAWSGITLSNPFPPLPQEFHGQDLGLRFRFYYNPDKTEDRKHEVPPVTSGPPGNTASPLDEVQVAAGSSHQFTHTPDGIPANSAAWSVTGSGCSGATCGSISAGLYTAPTKIPTPPRVTVTATSLTDSRRTVSTQVTIVEPNPSQQ